MFSDRIELFTVHLTFPYCFFLKKKINTYILDAKIYVNPTPNLLLLLQIYLQARLHLPVIPFLRPFLQYVLLSVLFYICATRVTDHYHHPTDVLAGAILGLLTSVFAVSTFSLSKLPFRNGNFLYWFYPTFNL